jgi:hypothetical protein
MSIFFPRSIGDVSIKTSLKNKGGSYISIWIKYLSNNDAKMDKDLLLFSMSLISVGEIHETFFLQAGSSGMARLIWYNPSFLWRLISWCTMFTNTIVNLQVNIHPKLKRLN